MTATSSRTTLQRRTTNLLDGLAIIGGALALLFAASTAGLVHVAVPGLRVALDSATGGVLATVFFGGVAAVAWWTRRHIGGHRPAPVAAAPVFGVAAAVTVAPDLLPGLAAVAFGAALAFTSCREDLRRDAGRRRGWWAGANLLVVLAGVAGVIALAAASSNEGHFEVSVNVLPAFLAAAVVRLLMWNKHLVASTQPA